MDSYHQTEWRGNGVQEFEAESTATTISPPNQAEPNRKKQKLHRNGCGEATCGEEEKHGEESGSTCDSMNTGPREGEQSDSAHDSDAKMILLEDANIYDETVYTLERWSKDLMALQKQLDEARLCNAQVLNTLYQIGAMREDKN